MLTKMFAMFLTAVLLAGSLGVSHMRMSMDMDGHMMNCPFMSGVSICTMSPMEMVAASQAFLSNFALGESFALFLLLIAAALIVSIFASFISQLHVLVRYRVPKRRYRLFHSFLDEAFSNGILNPKLY